MRHEGVLALRGGALGDFALSVPHLFALQNRFAALTIATHAKYVSFLQAMDLGAAYWPLDGADTTRTLYADPPHTFEGLISWLKPGSEHPTVAGRRFEVFVSRDEQADGHVADAYWRCLQSLGVRPADPPDLRSRFRGETGGDLGAQVVLHPGSGGDWKRWPLPHFLELAQYFLENGAAERVCILVGPEDESWGGEIRRRPPKGNVSIFESGDLARTARLLASASLYVGNDSGVTHLSALLGVPTLALHGPTSPFVWGVRGKAACHVFEPAGCSACAGGSPQAAAGHECLRNLTPAAVFRAAVSFADAALGR